MPNAPKKRRAVAGALLGIALLLSTVAWPAQIYSVFSIPKTNSQWSYYKANAVSIAGEFAGTFTWCSAPDQLGCLGYSTLAAIFEGPNSAQDCGGGNPTSGAAVDINALGQAVGYCNGAVFIFSSGGYSQLLPSIGTITPTAINATGQVTGYGPGSDAFLYSAGVFTDLGTLAGGARSEGLDINDAGIVVGDAVTAAGDDHAFVTSGMALLDLGTLAGGTTQTGYSSKAYSINNAGQIVGVSSAMNGSHAFLYSNGLMADLGTLGGTNSAAYSINNAGDIVGTSDLANGAATHAFLYTGHQLLDLNSLLVATDVASVLGDASYINDIGWVIVGGGYGVAVPAVFTPRSVSFGARLVGTSSAPEMITIRASGQYSFPVNRVVTAGPFSYVNNCPATLAPGAVCTISVTFQPTAAGSQSGDIFITGLDIPLQGTGSAPTVSLTASAPVLTAGEFATLTWTSANATACTASGGRPGDGWASSRPLIGTASVTETSAGKVAYMITCTGGSQSANASATISYSSPPSGGGGSVDLASLFTLMGFSAMCARRRWCPRRALTARTRREGGSRAPVINRLARPA